MNQALKLAGLFMLAVAAAASPVAMQAKSDAFTDVVKCIEHFYHVKHQNIPLLARAGIKAVRTAAKIRGGEYKQLAEAGSVRVAFFEDQTFDSHGQIASFKGAVQDTLAGEWSGLIQTLEPRNEEQTYVYVRDAGQKFHVMVITLERHDGTVVQATVSPEVLAELLKNPEQMGKELSDEATLSDP